MKVFILTEGGKGIGFGHITRCSALCDALEENKIRPYFVVNGDKSIEALLNGKRNKIFNWLKAKKQLFKILAGADIVIIDSYLARVSFYQEISKIVKRCVYLDDNKRVDYPEGIVVNGSIYAEEMDYPKREGLTYLLGAKYAPLRKEFWNVAAKKIKKNVKSAMIFFGGCDTRNIALMVLRFLVRYYPDLKKKILIGEGFKSIKEIEKFEDKHTDFIYFPDARKVKEIMLEADIAVSASGQTLYELARIGVPTIAIIVSKNQLNNARGWDRAGFIQYAGWYNDKRLFRNLNGGMEKLFSYSARSSASRIGRLFVNGKGARKVVNLCLKNVG